MMIALEQALPATVSAHADKNTEVFLHRLFDKRIRDRSEAMESALRDANRASGTMTTDKSNPLFPRSQSTMRAVSVESAAEASRGGSGAAVVTLFARASEVRWRRPAVMVAAGFAVAMGLAALRQSTQEIENPPSAVPPPALAAQPVNAPAPAAPPLVAPAEPNASAALSASATPPRVGVAAASSAGSTTNRQPANPGAPGATPKNATIDRERHRG